MMDETNVRFLKLRIEVEPVLPAREIATAWLAEIGFDMFEPDPDGLSSYAPENNVDAAELEEVKEALKSLEGLERCEMEETIIEQTNWNAIWEADYAAIDVEGRALMRAPFHDAPEAGLDLLIQPQMSFGTGHHPTTWMMIRLLLDEADRDSDLIRVLDMGCGTGVLAIAAKILGARDIWAVDIDQWAFENTLQNWSLNGLDPKAPGISIARGNAEWLRGRACDRDLVLANINRNILLQDMAAYDAVLKPGGRVLLSGFFTSDVASLRENAEKCGWKMSKNLEREGWAALAFLKEK